MAQHNPMIVGIAKTVLEDGTGSDPHLSRVVLIGAVTRLIHRHLR
jgi:hypothetical protein